MNVEFLSRYSNTFSSFSSSNSHSVHDTHVYELDINLENGRTGFNEGEKVKGIEMRRRGRRTRDGV